MSSSTQLQPVAGQDLDNRTETIDLFPVILVADRSWSMRHYMGVVNEAINGVIDDLARAAAVTDQFRLSVASFSDDARPEIASTSPNTILADASLVADASTSYHAMFDLLAAMIPSDVAALVSERDQLQADTGREHRLVRPVVILLSDGAPTDDEAVWKASYGALMQLEVAPKIVTVGIGDADPQVLRQIATDRHFQADEGSDVTAVIREMFAAISRSLIDSATAGQGVIIPEHVPGTAAMDPFLDL